MKKNTILPIEMKSFQRDISNLFSLDTEQILALFKLFNNEKNAFSTSEIKKLLKINFDTALSYRRILIYIVHLLFVHSDLEKIIADLKMMNLNKTKTSLFINLLEKINKKAIEKGNDLFKSSRYNSPLPTLGLYGIDVNHVFLEPNLKKMITFVKLSIANSDNTERISIELEANAFETFVLGLEDMLSKVHLEAKNLKETLGDRYVTLISE